jgi:hypothetical protein
LILVLGTLPATALNVKKWQRLRSDVHGNRAGLVELVPNPSNAANARSFTWNVDLSSQKAYLLVDRIAVVVGPLALNRLEYFDPRENPPLVPHHVFE